MVGECGSLLSGGQRQRSAIARATISSPPILIFDEATSALDSSSEALVEASIQRVSQNHTTIIIAHKLSLVQRADHIYILSRDQVAESGNHTALLAQDGQYSRTYHGQGHTEALDSQDSDSLPEPSRPIRHLMRNVTTAR
jgi:ABC-type multidrug transport system fused ATPase/permease subunit